MSYGKPMMSDGKFIAAGIVFIISFAILGMVITNAGHRRECRAKWNNSGYKVQYDFWSGCTVSADDGKTYIPSENYREYRE